MALNLVDPPVIPRPKCKCVGMVPVSAIDQMVEERISARLQLAYAEGKLDGLNEQRHRLEEEYRRGVHDGFQMAVSRRPAAAGGPSRPPPVNQSPRQGPNVSRTPAHRRPFSDRPRLDGRQAPNFPVHINDNDNTQPVVGMQMETPDVHGIPHTNVGQLPQPRVNVNSDQVASTDVSSAVLLDNFPPGYQPWGGNGGMLSAPPKFSGESFIANFELAVLYYERGFVTFPPYKSHRLSAEAKDILATDDVKNQKKIAHSCASVVVKVFNGSLEQAISCLRADDAFASTTVARIDRFVRSKLYKTHSPTNFAMFLSSWMEFKNNRKRGRPRREIETGESDIDIGSD